MKLANRGSMSNEYARHVGRVGALAVALGVGMAVATSPGLAGATPSTDNNVDGTTSATESTTTADTHVTADPAPVAEATDTTGDAPTTPATAAAGTASATAAPSPSETTQTNPVAPDVVVRSSGGALTSDKYSDDPSAEATVPPADPPESTPARPAVHSPSKAPESVAAQSSPPPPPAASTLRAAKLDAVSPDATSVRTLAVDTDQAEPQPDTMRMAAGAPPPTLLAADPITALLTVPATFIATATNLVAAVFAPLLSPMPGAPAESPLLWTILAFVRRQFVNDTPTVTSTVSAPDSLGNITISLARTDGDGDPLVYSATDGAKGTVALNPDGHSFTYTPNVGETGTDTLTITANDATNAHIHGLPGLINALSFGLLGYAGHTSAPTTVTVKLNTPPSLTASPGTPDQTTGKVTVTLVATDPDGNPLTFTVTPPLGATGTVGAPTLVDAANGTYAIVYTPSDEARHIASADTATPAQRTDSFTVGVDDGHGAKLTRTVDVAIAPGNDAPEFSSITSSTDSDGKVTGTIAFTDGDGDTLTYAGSVTTAKGIVVVNADGTFSYTPTDIARNGAAITSGPDVDKFDVTIGDGHGAAVIHSVTVTITPLAVTDDPTATIAAAKAVLDDVIGQRYTARAEFAFALEQMAGGIASSPDFDALFLDLRVVMDQLAAAERSGNSQAVSDAKADLDEMLGITTTSDEQTVLKIRAAAINTAENGLYDPIYAYLDAQALEVAPLSPLPFGTNYSPVLSRIESTTNLETGVITGTIVFVDVENQPLRYAGGVVRVLNSAFDALPLAVDQQTGAFTFTPTSPPSVQRPTSLRIDVQAIDSKGGFTVSSGILDYTARANVVLGPGAGGLAGTTVSVPAGKTPQEHLAELAAQMTDLGADLDAQLADINSATASALASLLAVYSAGARV